MCRTLFIDDKVFHHSYAQVVPSGISYSHPTPDRDELLWNDEILRLSFKLPRSTNGSGTENPKPIPRSTIVAGVVLQGTPTPSDTGRGEYAKLTIVDFANSPISICIVT